MEHVCFRFEGVESFSFFLPDLKNPRLCEQFSVLRRAKGVLIIQARIPIVFIVYHALFLPPVNKLKRPTLLQIPPHWNECILVRRSWSNEGKLVRVPTRGVRGESWCGCVLGRHLMERDSLLASNQRWHLLLSPPRMLS